MVPITSYHYTYCGLLNLINQFITFGGLTSCISARIMSFPPQEAVTESQPRKAADFVDLQGWRMPSRGLLGDGCHMPWYLGDEHHWLVVEPPTPLKKIRVRQLGWVLHFQYIWKNNPVIFQSPPTRSIFSGILLWTIVTIGHRRRISASLAPRVLVFSPGRCPWTQLASQVQPTPATYSCHGHMDWNERYDDIEQLEIMVIKI